MTKFTATFTSGKQITKTTADGFKNRIDFYNWICENRLGKTYGKVKPAEHAAELLGEL